LKQLLKELDAVDKESSQLNSEKLDIAMENLLKTLGANSSVVTNNEEINSP